MKTLILACLLTGCAAQPPDPPAVQALRETMRDCGAGRVTWQASRTNEPGVAWYSMRCEVPRGQP